MADDVKPAPALIRPGTGWRVAFARGFLDSDSGRTATSTSRWYQAGFTAGALRRRLAAKARH